MAAVTEDCNDLDPQEALEIANSAGDPPLFRCDLHDSRRWILAGHRCQEIAQSPIESRPANHTATSSRHQTGTKKAKHCVNASQCSAFGSTVGCRLGFGCLAVFAIEQPQQHGAGHKDRTVSTNHDADDQREGKGVNAFATEEVQQHDNDQRC